MKISQNCFPVHLLGFPCARKRALFKPKQITKQIFSKSHLIVPTTSNGSQRKNHPLCHETIRWKSDVPLTEGQLRSKRDEFWDTAPAFEGRREIWDALRAASIAAESLDFQLAQAILDGACISVPNGYLTGVFLIAVF